MASRGVSGFGRLWNRVSWTLFKYEKVGADEVGNKYYRKLEKNLDGEIVEKRFFKPPERGVYEPDSLAPEWSQWLRRTRGEVPTDADIARGVAQRELFRQRVAELDAEDTRHRLQERAAGAAGAPDMGSFVQQITDQYEKDKPQ
ncbi:hypothetical protein N2152v2_006024 [Parachlorella kessleri]